MVLCQNVASIVVGYLEPMCLGCFFINEGLDWGMKFIYDGSICLKILTYDECNEVFGMFPNIVLVGIHMYDMSINTKMITNLNVNVKKLIRCRLTCGDELHQVYLFEQLKLFTFSSLKTLNLINFGYKLNKCDLSGHDNLRNLNIVSNVQSSPYLKGISKCKELKCLRLVDVSLCDNDNKEISKCHNLIHLEISVQHIVKLNCKNLRTLIINNKNNSFLCQYFRNLNGIRCGNIRCIMLENCDGLEDIYKLREFPYLECVEIVGCGRLDVSVLDECVNLKWVRVRGCVGVSEKLRTLMLNCGKRCGHRYKYRRWDL